MGPEQFPPPKSNAEKLDALLGPRQSPKEPTDIGLENASSGSVPAENTEKRGDSLKPAEMKEKNFFPADAVLGSYRDGADRADIPGVGTLVGPADHARWPHIFQSGKIEGCLYLEFEVPIENKTFEAQITIDFNGSSIPPFPVSVGRVMESHDTSVKCGVMEFHTTVTDPVVLNWLRTKLPRSGALYVDDLQRFITVREKS